MADKEVPEEWYEQSLGEETEEEGNTTLEIDELKLEEETIHKAYLEMLFQSCGELEFGEHDGLARIEMMGGGQVKIVRSSVEIREIEHNPTEDKDSKTETR